MIDKFKEKRNIVREKYKHFAKRNEMIKQIRAERLIDKMRKQHLESFRIQSVWPE